MEEFDFSPLLHQSLQDFLASEGCQFIVNGVWNSEKEAF
jgi:hypothetical protein